MIATSPLDGVKGLSYKRAVPAAERDLRIRMHAAIVSGDINRWLRATGFYKAPPRRKRKRKYNYQEYENYRNKKRMHCKARGCPNTYQVRADRPQTGYCRKHAAKQREASSSKAKREL